MNIFFHIFKHLFGIQTGIIVKPRKRKKIIGKYSSIKHNPTVEQKKQAKVYLSQRIQELSISYGLPFAKLSIRDQKSRRGSCSSKKNISLNRRLYLMPVDVSDYVIIHELVHTVHMNHGKDFRATVGNLCPDYKKYMLWLKKNGVGLM